MTQGSDAQVIPFPYSRVRTSVRPHILVADDVETNRTVFSAMLRALNVGVDVVPNGIAALEAARARSYEMILLDVMMPDISGLEVTSALRAAGGWAAAVPIVAVTANALPRDRRRCLAAGMDDYLSKPIRSEDLKAVLHDWLPSRFQLNWRPSVGQSPARPGQ